MLNWMFIFLYTQVVWAAEVSLGVSTRDIYVGIPFELSVIAKGIYPCEIKHLHIQLLL